MIRFGISLLILSLFISSCASRDPAARLLQRSNELAKAAPEETGDPLSRIPASLDLEESVLMALERNDSFRISRLRPALVQGAEDLEQAAFDPKLRASLETDRSRDDRDVKNDADLVIKRDSAAAELGVSKRFDTGTAIDLHTTLDGHKIDSVEDRRRREGGIGLTVSQALLQGRGRDVNLARLRQARLDTDISLFELRASAEALTAAVENAYWDCVLAERAIAIFERSLAVAERDLQERQSRRQEGKLAESDITAAETEVAIRREFLIDARGTLAKRRLEFLRLLNPGASDADWQRMPELNAEISEIQEALPDAVEEHVRAALLRRPDLNQARLQVKKGELEIVYTRNGLLPRLDLFVRLGGSRYAESFTVQNNEDGYQSNFGVGIRFELPIGNRAAEARHARARFSHLQAEAALRNMSRLVQVDVRSAYVDVELALERITATRATRDLRARHLANEQEKLRAGLATNFQVFEAARDLLASEISEVEAIIRHRKAILNLHRQDATLLARRGIFVDPYEP